MTPGNAFLGGADPYDGFAVCAFPSLVHMHAKDISTGLAQEKKRQR